LSVKIIVSVVVVLSACYYDVEETLYPGTHCITSNITYGSTINSILQRNCYVCHSVAANTANVTLEGYDKLMVYVNNGKLVGAIRHEPGFKPMPQGASKLIDCDIAKIEQWIADGAPNN
jgi:hypothetical protein